MKMELQTFLSSLSLSAPSTAKSLLLKGHAELAENPDELERLIEEKSAVLRPLILRITRKLVHHFLQRSPDHASHDLKLTYVIDTRDPDALDIEEHVRREKREEEDQREE